MSKPFAISGADIGIGPSRLSDHALLIDKGNITAVCAISDIPEDIEQIELDGGALCPGLIDLQVNGGGGVLFNNEPSVESIETICRAHVKLGTCQVLVTLISADPETTKRGVNAAINAANKKVAGFLGLHLEGPHLAPSKKGAHSSTVLRKMSQNDLDELCAAKKQLPYMMVTVAPEMVTNLQIETMSAEGIVVSLGHSNATYKDATDAYRHGARCATHLYNAMSPLTHREPGMVGAALTTNDAYAGLIADGVHVDAAAIKIAVNSKIGRGKMFVVSDAMATGGSSIAQFELDGRKIIRQNGRLELSDGTLAGADTDMLSSVRYLINRVGIDPAEAIRMATSYPSSCIGAMDYLGSLVPGHSANVVHLDEHLALKSIWVDGVSQN